MKRSFGIVIVGIFISTILAACQPKAAPEVTSTETSTVVVATPVSTATDTPIATVLSVVTKPDVAVGSSYRYADGTLLVAVPAGSFTMGRQNGSDNPEHTVTLDDYWIYSTEVTNRQYARCVNAGICAPPDRTADLSYDDYAGFDNPVTGVDWSQAQTYCTYVQGRLPTEAEWEKAARGPDGSVYPWGSDAPSCDLLNFNRCVGNTSNVTSFPQGKSYYQALDMEGNIYEWVADWYDGLYYRKGPSDNPQGPSSGSKRAARSSGYTSSVDSVNTESRSSFDPDVRKSDLGFRCVVDDPTLVAPSCEQIAAYGPQAKGDAQSVHKNIPTTCPIVDLAIAQQRCGSDSTYVTVNTNLPALTTLSGLDNCTQISGTWDSFPQVYDCHSPTTATVSGVCTYSGLGDPYCAEHYNLDPNTGTCKWDGSYNSGSECLTGETFNSDNNCCSATLGTKADYPLCAVGSTFTDFGNGQYGCVTIAGFRTVAPISKEVLMPAVCQ